MIKKLKDLGQRSKGKNLKKTMKFHQILKKTEIIQKMNGLIGDGNLLKVKSQKKMMINHLILMIKKIKIIYIQKMIE